MEPKPAAIIIEQGEPYRSETSQLGRTQKSGRRWPWVVAGVATPLVLVVCLVLLVNLYANQSFSGPAAEKIPNDAAVSFAGSQITYPGSTLTGRTWRREWCPTYLTENRKWRPEEYTTTYKIPSGTGQAAANYYRDQLLKMGFILGTDHGPSSLTFSNGGIPLYNVSTSGSDDSPILTVFVEKYLHDGPC